ncbi:hypothetical protein MPSEU_000512900 [Mayamaea pseudoterrestris]|nr:hypothetical protein MPSEU_000512900 [Mayamaea pseudoterrestris]
MATLVGHSWGSPSGVGFSSSRGRNQPTHEDMIEQWWDVSTQALVARCMRKHHWTLAFGQRCLRGYRQFMELKTVMNDWTDVQLAAPMAINVMWEEHILDALRYSNDCSLLFGHTIGYDPDASLNDGAWVNRIKTTKIAFQARFGDDMDQDVWNWGDVEYGMNESTPMNVDNGGHLGVSHMGRLPVAPVDRSSVIDGNSFKARQSTIQSHPCVTTQTEDSDDAHTPRKYTRAVSPARSSPTTTQQRRSASPVRARAHALASKAASHSPKPSTPTGNDPITIHLKDQDTGEQTYFSLRYRIPLRVMFAVYAERKNIDQDKLRFSYNGQSLTGYETPYSIGMDEGEHIDVQINGRR